MQTVSFWGLRAVLAAAGLFIVFTGINIAFGGMATLGLQGSADFFAVTDEAAYLNQDSHVRFLGGLWLGMGALFVAGAVRPAPLRPALNMAFALIFVGGLARFTMMRPDIVFGPDIVGSLAAELILMPVLYFWTARVCR